ncbi:FAD-dependent oxidoreductase [bacterium]|nr:FAD-dependent oxidoreductase [bacterium]
MKKVGIIGAGIAGLTCGYRLVQKGIPVVIFEKKVIVGGRIPFAGAVATERFHPRLISLIKELGLEALKVPLSKTEQGFFTSDGQLLELRQFQMASMKQLGLKGAMYFMKLNRFVNRVRFDVNNFDPRLVKIRNISFEEYLKDCPEIVRKIVVEPMMLFTFGADLSQLSAEYGLTHIRLGNELGSGKAFTFEENNIATVTNVLDAKLKEEGTQIFTSAEVKKINKQGDKFTIVYEKEGEKTEEVDTVVLAVPLDEVKRIFPELNLESDVDYRDSKCIFVEGKLRWPGKKFIVGMPGNPANLRALFNVVPYSQLVYPMDETKEVDLERLYEEYKIVDEEEIKPALPIIGPNTKVPELTTKMKGVYLCGDFYYYPWLETSVATAEKVADLISKEG